MVRALLLLAISAGIVTSVTTAKAEVLLPDSVEFLLRQTPKDSAYIVNLNRLAFTFLKSNPEVGRSIAEKSMAFSKVVNFDRGVIRSLNIIGSSYWVTGNYESALNYYHQSARESEKIKYLHGLAEAYHNMGEVYKKLGDYSKAVKFLRTSMQWDRIKENYDLALYNIGEAYYLMGKYDSASHYFDRSLSGALKTNSPRTIAYAYTGLGLIKYKDKEYYQALAYFTKAERLWKEQGETRSLIQTYQDFADTFLALSQQSRALDYISMAIVLADEISAPDLQISNYKLQSRVYVELGELDKAMDAMETHVSMKDSIYHEKRRLDIARLQAQFESGAREIENQQLKANYALQHAQLRTQKLMLMALTAALIAAGFMAFILFRQTKKVAEVKEEIQSLNKSLESKIEERTQRLTWQNLKLAEYAHANAHQLRAPVVSILGLLNLIERMELPAEDKILVDKLKVCGHDLDRITRVISRNLEEDELLK